MKLSHRLVVILAVTSLVPLGVAGAMLTSIGRDALESQVRASQLSAAQNIAAATDRWLSGVLARLRLSADVFDLAAMDGPSRVGALRIVYRQLTEVDIVALYDAEGGRVVDPVFLTDDDPGDRHLPVTEEELAAFEAAVPFEAASRDGVAVGEAYRSERKHVILLPVAVRLQGAGGADWFLAAEVVMRPVQGLVAQVPLDDVGTAYVVDGGGRVLAHPDGERFLERVSGVLGTGHGGYHRRQLPEGAVIGATAPLVSVGWTAVVDQTEAQAFRAVRTMVRRTGVVVGLALVFAVVAGLLLSRGTARSIGTVSQGARRIAAGDLEQRLPVEGAEEVRDLAESFNQMAHELGRSREEIEAFNRELQARVEERTTELRRAQAQLLQSRKLAAIGELGAGVAHELNNPLTGILGLVQLLKRRRGADDPDARFLDRIEMDARRCRDVTMNLLKFSEQTDEPQLVDTDLNEVVKSATTLQTSMFANAEVALALRLSEGPVTVKADAGNLQQVLLNLLSNSLAATDGGGRVEVATEADGELVQLTVTDTGRGIPPENLDRVMEPFFTTKDDWHGAGLGLSVAYRIVEDHHGTLKLESEVGKGTRVTIRLPKPMASTALSAAAEPANGAGNSPEPGA